MSATVGGALDAAAARLAAAGIESARLDARVLLGHALAVDPGTLALRREVALAADAAARFDALVARRAAHEPVAYIVGHREFWSLDFRVTPDVLIPRPDSETLVEAALAEFPERDRALDVLDLGTGSGCLLLAVLHERPRARGVGVDVSAAAVAVATANAASLGLGERAHFVTRNWHEYRGGPFDLVLSNPPYIARADIALLAPDVREHEPRGALEAGADGLDAYRSLAGILPGLLKPAGRLIVEIGAGQANQAELCLRNGGLRPLLRRRDLAGLERCLVLAAPAR